MPPGRGPAVSHPKVNGSVPPESYKESETIVSSSFEHFGKWLEKLEQTHLTNHIGRNIGTPTAAVLGFFPLLMPHIQPL